MKKILVVFTGGTFSMMIDEKTGGAIPKYSGNELLGMIPEAKSLAEIECFDFGKYQVFVFRESGQGESVPSD